MTSRVFWWKWRANRWLKANFPAACLLVAVGLFLGALLLNIIANP